jgi:hypothetical protein
VDCFDFEIYFFNCFFEAAILEASLEFDFDEGFLTEYYPWADLFYDW